MVLIYFDLTTDSNYLLAFDQMQKLRHDKEFLSETFPGITFETVFHAGFEICLFFNAN